ncbi:tyrosine-type recombinase/integrase [Salegentibacter sp. LM13S]|uniref:tyrosine-type recombinase/integrase n=1 Tax=Salegentibacter lacus TaxID=2873599 RepID=UPI001CCA8C86|nr:tyrosine-type recombinase/integrase [Salegentibacter lacus]MBZ9632538.1 tyrosine-type recombinase/integrase [Salegentibacter lacus]
MVGSTFLDFDKSHAKALKLIRTGENPTFGLLVIAGINLGLRISDLLQLKYGDLKALSLTIVEGKTKKTRKLKVNHNIQQAMEYFKEENENFFAFRSQKGSVYSSQHVNRLMKQYFKRDKISSHSLRKTFGRRVWDNNQQSEKALLYLSELFNHTSISVTRKYLGIRQQELDDIYMSL